MKLHKGEIIGLGGLSGCGMHDIGRAAFGLEKLTEGTIEIHGKKITTPLQAIKKGAGYISKNRDTEALIIDGSIEENIVLDCFSGSGTTAIASIQLNRNFIAIENNPKHYKASLERLYSEISQIKLPIMKGGLYAV